MSVFTILALVGIVHVHHAPSHDSRAPFEDVIAAGHSAGLDFLVLTEHVPAGATGPLPAAERQGIYIREHDGHRLLVLVGGEFGTASGHLLGLDLKEIVAAEGRPGAEVIEAIHQQGGFAVIPHPFHYGGWQDWGAPFDGMEVHNNASSLIESLGPLIPWRLFRRAWGFDAAYRDLLRRPGRALRRWEALLQEGRKVVAFSGAEAHQNLNLLGWQLDPYEALFRAVQMHCPEDELLPDAVWALLRSGRCHIRYRIFDDRAPVTREVGFPSGRSELWFDHGRHVLEIRPPPSPR